MCRFHRRDRTSCRFEPYGASERLLLHGGTDSSNLRSSSGESRANLTSSAQILEKARSQWRASSHGRHQHPDRGSLGPCLEPAFATPPRPPAGSIPMGRHSRSAASLNQASVQSRVPVLPCRLCSDAGSRRTLNHSASEFCRFRAVGSALVGCAPHRH
jgi:hypothetical protein